MRRTKHSLSHYVNTTFDMGQLVPVANLEILPGDSIRMSTSALIRCSPLMAPVMHPVTVRIHHWFVPHRLVMEDWEPFITGGKDGEGDGALVPRSDGFVASAGSLADYLGVPIGVAVSLSLFRFRAYNKIFNEYYRDQDLTTELAEDNTILQRCCWEKDAFTAARPWTQKGPQITVPLGDSAPVISTGAAVQFSGIGGGAPNRTLRNWAADVTARWHATRSSGSDSADMAFGGTTGLEADLSAATGIDIVALREALALQRFAEARAQYGSRYTEYLRYLGIRSSDARLQRPEYLGGGRATISFSEVLRTGTGDDPDVEVTPVGEMAGHGISALRTRSFVRFFEEHGTLLTLASVRPKSIYIDGLDKEWSKRNKEEWWQRELEQIGQQEVLYREVKAGHATPNAVMGYNDRYYEYRHRPSYVTGEMRNVLNDWHFARDFSSGDPALNSAFVTCTPTKRPFAEQTQNSLWCMFNHSIQARRMVGNRTIGRVF